MSLVAVDYTPILPQGVAFSESEPDCDIPGSGSDLGSGSGGELLTTRKRNALFGV
jgi:hypothetical protein